MCRKRNDYQRNWMFYAYATVAHNEQISNVWHYFWSLCCYPAWLWHVVLAYAVMRDFDKHSTFIELHWRSPKKVWGAYSTQPKRDAVNGKATQLGVEYGWRTTVMWGCNEWQPEGSYYEMEWHFDHNYQFSGCVVGNQVRTYVLVIFRHVFACCWHSIQSGIHRWKLLYLS